MRFEIAHQVRDRIHKMFFRGAHANSGYKPSARQSENSGEIHFPILTTVFEIFGHIQTAFD